MPTNLAADVHKLGRVVPVAAGSGSNAPVVITLTGVERERHHLWVQWSYSGAPTGGNIVTTGTEGDETDLDIAAAGTGRLSDHPLVGTQGGTVTVTLAAGGSGVVGKLVVAYVTLPG